MNLRKGISPVIATVIIVAVALAIAIAVVGWIMGIWGAVTGGTEALKIMLDSVLYINDTKAATLVLHIRNEGSGSAIIDKIVIGEIEFEPDTTTIPPGDHIIRAYNYDAVSQLSVGATYTVKIYTKAGYVYSALISSKEGQTPAQATEGEQGMQGV